MKIQAILVSALIVVAAQAAPPPFEVPVYRMEKDKKDVVLLPVDVYRSLTRPPMPEPEPTPTPTPAPTPAPTQPDLVREVHITGVLKARRVELSMAIACDLTRTGTRDLSLVSQAQTLVVTSFAGPGQLTQSEAGTLVVQTAARGHQTFRIGLALPTQRETQAFELTVPVPIAPVQTLELEVVGEPDLVVIPSEGLLVDSRASGRTLRVRLVGRGASSFKLRFEQPPVAPAAASPSSATTGSGTGAAEPDWEPELAAEVATMVSVGDTNFRVKSALAIQVRRSPVRQIILQLGPGSTFLDVTGANVAEWEPTAHPSGARALVRLKAPVQDRVDLLVESEVVQGGSSGATEQTSGPSSRDVVPVHLPEAYHEEHSMGIVRPAHLPTQITPGHTWRDLSQSRIPDALQALVGQDLPAVFACERFPRSAAQSAPEPIKVSWTKLAEVALLAATIDLADAVTIVTEDGNLVGRVTYRVQNNSQQFLKVTPPGLGKVGPQAEPATVYVAGKPVRSARTDDRCWLIPLGKSSRVTSGAAPFEVQITYVQSVGRLESGRRMTLELPKTDLAVSTIRWKVGLPKEWSLSPTGGNVRSEAGYRPVIFTGGGDVSEGAGPAALFFEDRTLPIALELPRCQEEFHFSSDPLDKDAPVPTVEFLVKPTIPAMTQRALAFLLGVLVFYEALRRRPAGRHRWVATGVGLLGTFGLMAGFSFASATVGLGLHVALGLFMGTVIFGLSRVALGQTYPGSNLDD